MFTGIVTETGKVVSLSKRAGAARLKVECAKTAEGAQTGDSVAVNGVCLSVVGAEKDAILFDVVGNTLAKTGLKRLKKGDKVDLENAVKQGDKISGHTVTGHIDAERRIKAARKTPEGWALDIEALDDDGKYLVPRGSVAVDGISLTVAETRPGYFRLYIIPHTFDNTILKLKKTGDYVNVEFDILAKYAEKQKASAVTEELLKRTGFM